MAVARTYEYYIILYPPGPQWDVIWRDLVFTRGMWFTAIVSARRRRRRRRLTPSRTSHYRLFRRGVREWQNSFRTTIIINNNAMIIIIRSYSAYNVLCTHRRTAAVQQ